MKRLISIPLLYLTLLWLPSRTWILVGGMPAFWQLSQQTAQADAMSVQTDATVVVENRAYFESANQIPEKGLAAAHQSDRQSRSLGLQTITAYSSTYDQTDQDPYTMASGQKVQLGALACPRAIPFGVRIVVAGVGEFRCLDRTALSHDGVWDIWLPTREEAIRFGKQKREVTILEESE